MDEVITRISEHEGGATDRCHHQVNSWRQKPLQQLGDYMHTHAQSNTHKHMRTVHKNYCPLYWKETSAVIINAAARQQSHSFFCVLWSKQSTYKIPQFILSFCQACMGTWNLPYTDAVQCFLSCWHPHLALLSSCLRKIETLMKRGILLCELLLRSFPNGEKFNYQLICCVVSGDTKFPIVSASIKCFALTPLFRHWEWEIKIGTNAFFLTFCLSWLCTLPTKSQVVVIFRWEKENVFTATSLFPLSTPNKWVQLRSTKENTESLK